MKNIAQEIIRRTEQGQASVLVSVADSTGPVPRGQGARMLVGEKGLITGTVGGGTLELLAIKNAHRVLELRENETRAYDVGSGSGGLPTGMVCGGNVTLAFEYIAPGDAEAIKAARQELSEARDRRVLIFGAGHCARALCAVSAGAGFRPVIFDDSAELTEREDYPEAEQVICGDFLNISDHLDISGEDYVVVMTNDHLHDHDVMKQVLPHEPVYMGVMGSRKKRDVIMNMLKTEGFSDSTLSAVHTPVGLSIGAVTPEEIAISIAAEMISVRSGKDKQ